MPASPVVWEVLVLLTGAVKVHKIGIATKFIASL